MDDREDELRLAIARERMARRILDAIAAEKLAKAWLFEEGIREQMRLREQLLADRAECLGNLARAEANTERVGDERDAAAAAVDEDEEESGAAPAAAAAAAGGRKSARSRGRWGKGPARRRSRYMIRLISSITDLPWARHVLTYDAKCAHRSMDRRPPWIWPNILRIRTM